jgi:hypothetical protein
MSTTTSSVNPAMTSLLADLSAVGSPLLSSPRAMAALEKASPSDIVQLSVEAIQLEGVNALFGETSSSAQSAGDSLLSMLYQPASTTDPLASLEQALGISSNTATSSSNGSLQTALSSYQQTMQAGKMNTLLGSDGSTGLTESSSLFG